MTSLVISGCAGMLPNPRAQTLERATEHNSDLDEVVSCTRGTTSDFTRFGNYRLVFMSRDFVNTVLVWIDPNSGRVVVIKKTDRKTCILHNTMSKMVFTPYDKSANAINRLIEAADKNSDE